MISDVRGGQQWTVSLKLQARSFASRSANIPVPAPFSPILQYPDIEGNFCFTDKLALGPTQQGTPTDIFLNNKTFKAALLSWFLYICRRLVLLCNILVLSLHWWHDLFLVCCNIQVYLEFFKVISLLICMQLERFEKGIKGKYQDYGLLGEKVNNT